MDSFRPSFSNSEVSVFHRPLGDVYHDDQLARERGLTRSERLHFHQQHSRPVMDDLQKWLDAQLKENKVEPNSGLGKAISYMLKHWQGLTLFLREPGAPLDNNIVGTGVEKSNFEPEKLSLL